MAMPNRFEESKYIANGAKVGIFVRLAPLCHTKEPLGPLVRSLNLPKYDKVSLSKQACEELAKILATQVDSDDLPVLVNDERRRNLMYAIGLHHTAIPPAEIATMKLPRKLIRSYGAKPTLLFDVKRDAEDLESIPLGTLFRLVFIVALNNVRVFRAAWTTPRSPKVDKDNFASQRAE